MRYLKNSGVINSSLVSGTLAKIRMTKDYFRCQTNLLMSKMVFLTVVVIAIGLYLHKNNPNLSVYVIVVWCILLSLLFLKPQKLIKIFSDNSTKDSYRLETHFLRNISHQVRTPMNAIIGFSQLAKENINDDVTNEYLNNVLNSSKQLLNLIDNVVEMSKLECGEAFIVKKHFNLSDFIISYFEEINRTYKNSNQFDLELEDGLNHYIDSDKRALTAILNQLIANATTYTKNGTITIGCKRRGTASILYVNDTGMGVQEDDLNKITAAFYRGCNVDINSLGKVGLGLSICHKYTLMLGGTLQINSIPNKGTRVYICL